jgi:non-homologous end joining protein Ku
MAMRATWKGVLQLGKQKLQVKLYAAVQDTTVHFHLLHAADGTRVEQRLVSSRSGEPVESQDVKKGFALDSGTFVILNQKELKAIEPEARIWLWRARSAARSGKRSCAGRCAGAATPARCRRAGIACC